MTTLPLWHGLLLSALAHWRTSFEFHSVLLRLRSGRPASSTAQEIEIYELVISAEGDMDARGFFGVSDEINKGYKRIRVNIEVKTETDVDTIKTLAMFSPVYEMVSRAVPVELNIRKI